MFFFSLSILSIQLTLQVSFLFFFPLNLLAILYFLLSLSEPSQQLLASLSLISISRAFFDLAYNNGRTFMKCPEFFKMCVLTLLFEKHACLTHAHTSIYIYIIDFTYQLIYETRVALLSKLLALIVVFSYELAS